MALSAAEKQRVMALLDELDRNDLDRVLASIEAFGRWLQNKLYSIYCKVKDALSSFWKAVCDLLR